MGLTMDHPSLLTSLDGPEVAEFDGETYDHDLDVKRLSRQLDRVYEAMKDGQWRTLSEIRKITGDPEGSIGARLRDLRKEKFGAFGFGQRRRGEAADGLWEFRVGAKGESDSKTRESIPAAHNVALNAADQMIQFLSHKGKCAIQVDWDHDRTCTCGLYEIRAAYREARQETRR